MLIRSLLIFAFILAVPIGSANAQTASQAYAFFGITGFNQKTFSFLDDVKGNGPSFGFGTHLSDIMSAEISFSNLEYDDDYSEGIQ